MIQTEEYINGFGRIFLNTSNMNPWEITSTLAEIINNKISKLNEDYNISSGIAIHKTAIVEDRAILKAPIIISENCFVGANAYLRNGVYLGSKSSIGPACEIKSSIIFNYTEIAHLNFVGDSIFGSNINFEAGAIAANYYNERVDKTIVVLHKSNRIKTTAIKFGSLIGDNCKIGANAVLSPGTILTPSTIVKRLELIEQIKL